TETITCPICGVTAVRAGRRRYCSDACRQAAWRRRAATPDPPTVLPANKSRRAHTIYQCSECDTRFHAEQWCYDCNRPARRLGPGGSCTCGELITVDELLNTEP
ncbi:MAG: hypothetical protein ACR2JQ_06380, partial [Mycobacteriales bacterium]